MSNVVAIVFVVVFWMAGRWAVDSFPPTPPAIEAHYARDAAFLVGPYEGHDR